MATVSRGDWVRETGLTGFGKVTARWCYPGDQIATVEVTYYRPRTGKVSTRHTVRETDIAEVRPAAEVAPPALRGYMAADPNLDLLFAGAVQLGAVEPLADYLAERLPEWPAAGLEAACGGWSLVVAPSGPKSPELWVSACWEDRHTRERDGEIVHLDRATFATAFADLMRTLLASDDAAA